MKEQENHNKIMKSDEPISLKPPLKWHFSKECGEYITRLVKHKVCSVSETRTGEIVSWRGDFDNDEYFLVLVIDGVIYAACHEHEMMIPYDLHTVAYSDEVFKILEIKDQVEQFRATAQAKTTTLPALMNNLKFQEIMGIFMWEYISDKVEIYETITL